MSRKYLFFGLTLILIFLIALIVTRLLNAAKMKNLSTTNANVKAFLQTLRQCEGTAGDRGYKTIQGYCYFDDYSVHPNRKCPNGSSTAAGAYQFIYSTWKGLQSKLLLPDFSPASQDAAAVELIRECGALDAVIAGDIDTACEKLLHQWESLPYGLTSQPHKPLATVENYFTAAGGQLA